MDYALFEIVLQIYYDLSIWYMGVLKDEKKRSQFVSPHNLAQSNESNSSIALKHERKLTCTYRCFEITLSLV